VVASFGVFGLGRGILSPFWILGDQKPGAEFLEDAGG